jgi:addiction module RelE/StbE family toxin
MYKIIIAPRAQRELKAIAKRHRKALAEAIESLKEDPFQGKPLTRDLTKRYSYKVGVYRIIYKINSKDRRVDIITAGHRATVYQ